MCLTARSTAEFGNHDSGNSVQQFAHWSIYPPNHTGTCHGAVWRWPGQGGLRLPHLAPSGHFGIARARLHSEAPCTLLSTCTWAVRAPVHVHVERFACIGQAAGKVHICERRSLPSPNLAWAIVHPISQDCPPPPPHPPSPEGLCQLQERGDQCWGTVL